MSKFKTVGSVAAGLLVTASVPALAQSAESAPQDVPNEVDEIIVTAQKRSESINTVPMSITAASGVALERLGVRDVADLIKVVPSFQVTQTFNSAPAYSIRGVGFIESSVGSRPTVGIYQDEVEVPFAVMAKGATLDLERVEVLKGPQGTLFGQNATGGLINYIANKPTDTLRYGGSVEYGRFSQGYVEGFVSGPISDKLGVRVAARHEFGNDWQKSYTRDDSIGARDFTTARIITEFRPTETVKFQLNLNGWKDRSDTQPGQLALFAPRAPVPLPLLENYPSAPKDNRAADWDPGNYRSDSSFWQASLRADIELGDIGTLTSLSSYAKSRIRFRIDADGTALQNTDLTDDVTQETASQELRLSGDAGERLRYMVGANYSWYKNDQREFVDAGYTWNNQIFAPFGIAGQNTQIDWFTNSRYRSKAVFGSLDFDISDTLVAHASVRYSKTTGKSVGCTIAPDEVAAQGWSTLLNVFRGFASPLVNIPVGGCLSANANFVPELYRLKLSEDSIPFRLGLDWKPNSTTLVYANVSRGFKGGSFPVIGALLTASSLPAKQEELLAYEAGVKIRLAQGLQVNGAAFYYDYKDKQITGRRLDPGVGSLQQLVNIPKSHVLGAEAQVNWVPVEGLVINASVTYLKTKIDGCSSVQAAPGEPGCQATGYYDFNDLARLVRMTGQRFAQSPEWSGVVDAEYKFPVNSNDLSAFLGGSARAQTYTLAYAGQDSSIPANDPRNAVYHLDGYALFDVRAGLEGPDGRWRFTVWGRNITDKYYRIAAQYATDNVVTYTGRPATYGITLTFKN